MTVTRGDLSQKIFTVVMSVDGTLATGDGKVGYVMPCHAVLIHAQCGVLSKGATSGATTVMIRNATGPKDMLAAVMSIAYNATDAFVEGTLSATEANILVVDGDKIYVDIDEVPGTASTDLVVNLTFVGR